MTWFDIFIQNYFASVREPGITEAMYLVSKIFDFSIYFALLSIAVTYLIYLFRGIRYSLLFLHTLIFGAVLVFGLKTLFNIPRPTDFVSTTFGKSFPSYHATMATIFFVMLMYVFDDYFPTTPKILFNSLCSMIILTVAFSRIYLGAHWLSDVLFGMLLGILISYFSVWFFRAVTKTSAVRL